MNLKIYIQHFYTIHFLTPVLSTCYAANLGTGEKMQGIA